MGPPPSKSSPGGRSWARSVRQVLQIHLIGERAYPPRLYSGHLGELAEDFGDLVKEHLRQHCCCAVLGLGSVYEVPLTGGIWLIGPHGALRGSKRADFEHEEPESEGSLPKLPSIRAAHFEREGFDVGIPTVFLGRSRRGMIHSKKRSRDGHVPYVPTDIS